MKKKLFKYTIRIVLGLFTLLWGLAAWAALYPDEDYHHCEGMLPWISEQQMKNNLSDGCHGDR